MSVQNTYFTSRVYLHSKEGTSLGQIQIT